MLEIDRQNQHTILDGWSPRVPSDPKITYEKKRQYLTTGAPEIDRQIEHTIRDI